MKPLDIILYYILFPFTCISFILSPVVSDIRIFLGVAHIADAFYQFPQGLDIAWETRPIANRAMNWILYKVASIFVSFDDPVLFGIAIKILTLIAIIGVSYYFSRKIHTPYGFLLTFFSLTMVSNFCIGQTEHWVVMLSLVAIGLAIDESWLMVGLVISTVTLFKGVTVLMFIPVLIAAYLLERKEPDWIGIGAGIVTAINIWVISVVLFWKYQIGDIMMMPLLAEVGTKSLYHYLTMTIAYTFMSAVMIPVLIMGMVAGLLYLAISKDKLAVALMWIVPLLVVPITGEFYIYHYYLLVVPAIVSIILLERTYHDHTTTK